MMSDSIEKKILLRAPRSRVWRALVDQEEFGRWFGCRLPAGSFAPGHEVAGHVTHPGYEHLQFRVVVDRVEPERLLAWRWHPAPMDPEYDYSVEPETLVTFTLEDADGGTLLTVVESGFEGIPLFRRAEAYEMNEGGWTGQMTNIERHVAANA